MDPRTIVSIFTLVAAAVSAAAKVVEAVADDNK